MQLQFFSKLFCVCSYRCDGRKSCSVSAVNSVFSDPCVGTHKYLDVSCLCLPFSKSVTDTHYHSKIGVGKMFLKEVSFLKSFFDLIRCNGKKSCQLNASNASFFSDPCPDVHKYLEVMYSCI
ncbi:L-rhamnose-binding lectin CSL1-like [Sinocyclocheilus rhinocerous]|uniref:L-rhamnose-binding lectin CSL1-like n=1 Tax=Sinocyclocheilus rhinocerous TaxID=307959 RepID=UPI0007BADC91|nr:PREDICTED: L-rhamnose-binding lectin CSL1-like [Sinocyclocheilus rhinocerous]